MWQIRVVDQEAYAEDVPDDVAWLEVVTETKLRLWSVSFRTPAGWNEQAWLTDAWVNDRRFAGPRSILRELIVASPQLPKVAAVRIIDDLRARRVI